MLSEAAIIATMQSIFPQYIGDDAAVLPYTGKDRYVVSKDLLVEDIHFRTKYYTPEDLACKALQVNLSDLAAMGATPEFVVLGIAIPAKHSEYAKTFLASFANACKENAIVVIGGDTTGSPDKLYISVTAIGEVENSRIKYRNGASVGDLMCVVGSLGYAHLGLQALERSIAGLDEFKAPFLKPKAKLCEGIWLGQRMAVTAMMDISDGLYVDLSKLCSASDKGAEIELNHFIASEKFIAACAVLKLDTINTMLTGGEDYGLLFTVEASCYSAVVADFRSHFGYELQLVGRITSGSGVILTENGMPKNLDLRLFTHFGGGI